MEWIREEVNAINQIRGKADKGKKSFFSLFLYFHGHQLPAGTRSASMMMFWGSSSSLSSSVTLKSSGSVCRHRHHRADVVLTSFSRWKYGPLKSHCAASEASRPLWCDINQRHRLSTTSLFCGHFSAIRHRGPQAKAAPSLYLQLIQQQQQRESNAWKAISPCWTNNVKVMATADKNKAQQWDR